VALAAGVWAAWLGLTAVGIAGYWIMKRGYSKSGLGVLAAYGVLTLGGLDHYTVAPFSAHTTMMNMTIWLEVTTATLLLVAVARLMLKTSAMRSAALVASIIFVAPSVRADEIKVVTSGAFTAAYLEITPAFERATHHTITTVYGASMGSTPTSIPNRLERGELLDVVIMADTALDALIRAGKVVAGSRVDLVRSRIGMAVRTGAPKPDISTVAALTRTLLAAKSVAFSDSASGVYISSELLQRLGIADRVMPKSKRILGEPVGAVVARGEAEIGLQQISELLPEKGIDIVGPLPADAQKITVFSAGIVAGAKSPDAARALIAYLASPAAAAAITKAGLEPANPR
jgi:molybdate transport system substrate-binding protein